MYLLLPAEDEEAVLDSDRMSTEYLGRYLREREFHWNRRKTTDGERTVDAIRGAAGMRCGSGC